MAGRWLNKSTIRSLMSGLMMISCMTQAMAEDGTAESAQVEARRSAAVALNYSRAALHHIRQNPSLRVLYEEQEKILNHLNLNGVADEEVLKLYSAVLDEISQIQIADKEKVYLKDHYRHQFRSQVTTNAFNLIGDVATAHYTQAVRTGANSWWDYRNTAMTHDLDQWKVEKDRMKAVVGKSSQFLDTSWKMARDKQIPDRWLVRNDDLDRLEETWKEPNPTVRLRVLKRMESFLECYPPYWYYVARTQQSLGQLTAANETYNKLASLGTGHFRKDEMLAAGLANRALIQAHLGLPGAAESAKQAMQYSTDVWEANLVCAVVLQRQGHAEDAEDAILRNLDLNLERPQSRIALLGLYCQTQNIEKLTAQLHNAEVIREVPVPMLLACAQAVNHPRISSMLVHQLQSTLQAAPRYNLGRDDFVLTAGPNWQLHNATVKLHWGNKDFRQPRLAAQKDSTLLSFDGVGEFGSLFGHLPDDSDLKIIVKYPDFPEVTLHLAAREANEKESSPGNSARNSPRYPVYRLANLESERVAHTTAKKVLEPIPNHRDVTTKLVTDQETVRENAGDETSADADADAHTDEATDAVEDTVSNSEDSELVTPEIEVRGK